MRFAWCSCGWVLRDGSDGSIRFAVPTMVDHWRQGHTLRVWSIVRRTFVTAVNDYHGALVGGLSRAAWEEKYATAARGATRQEMGGRPWPPL